MICVRCQTPNPDDSQFCRNCAAPLAAAATPPGQNPPPPPPGSPYGYGGNQQVPPHGFQQQQNYGGFAGQPVSAGASGRAITSMILSILSILSCCLLLGVPGLILGKMEMNAISQGQASQAGRTFAVIGFWAGIAGTVLSVISGLFYMMMAMMGGGGGYGYPY